MKTVVTCALPYANGPMHVGHIRSTYLPGDIYYRYLKMRKEDAIFICASDEHGTPITVTADKEGKNPSEIADRYHDLIKKDLEGLNIKFDVFSRTSSDLNIKRSQEFFTEANKKGYVFEKEVEQYYCGSCKRFLPDRYVEGTCPNCGAEGARGDHCEKCAQHLDSLKDARCLICGSSPELKTTKHWFFKLTSFKKQLKDFLSSDKLPENVKNYAVTWLDKLQDWCITRDMSWGVPLPIKGADDKVLYVWWDAPIGYVSATEDWGIQNKKDWEPYWKKGKIVHFIGKDIIYHHALFWPAMLLAHGKYKTPWSIVAGEYLSLEGRKMSTSRGWIIWVKDFLEKYPADYMRYYLTITSPLMSDMDFSWKEFEARINNELSDVLGNFVHRVMIFTQKFFGGKVPKPEKVDKSVTDKIAVIHEKATSHMDEFNFMDALKDIMELAKFGNQYFNDKEPWKNKDDGTPIYMGATIARSLSILLSPILPETAQKIWGQLGYDGNVSEQDWDSAKELIKEGQKLGKPEPLIPKVEVEVPRIEFSGKKVIPDEKISKEVKSENLSVALAEVSGVLVKKRSRVFEKQKKKAVDEFDYAGVEKTINSYRYMLEKLDKGTEGLSSENLVQFVRESGMLPNINTLADVYNYISFKTGLIMGAYDARNIEGNVVLKVADGSESFVPIGGSKPSKIEPGEYVVADESNKVITRWLTKQHEKVKVDEHTTNAIICIQGNKDIPEKKVFETLEELCKLIVQYCGGEYKILYPK
jgi:methionyl-tRNA synthetase